MPDKNSVRANPEDNCNLSIDGHMLAVRSWSLEYNDGKSLLTVVIPTGEHTIYFDNNELFIDKVTIHNLSEYKSPRSYEIYMNGCANRPSPECCSEFTFECDFVMEPAQ